MNPNLIGCQGAETGASETGETGGDGPETPFCAPLEPGVDGESHECHGSGNGWLDLDIHPVGAQDPKCLNWGDKEPPKHPTSKDCVPIDITSLPNGVDFCANKVTKANGELAAIELGPGASPSLDFGHVKSATLHLQCALDNKTPYVLVGDACDSTPNMPTPEAEPSMGGLAAVGAVSITGPMGNLSASLHDISFVFTETPDAMGLVEFRLEQFEAHASTVSVGSFAFIDPSVRLVAPANGQLGGELISFPPGSLRMEVSAAIAVEGQLLFDGEPVSGEYVNTQWATATRSVDDEFAFIEATFETGGYRFVLDTEEGSFAPL